MTTIMFQLSKPQWGFFSSNVIYQIRLIAGFFYYLSNTTDVTEGLPRSSKIILCFQWCLCSRVFLFLCCVFKTVCLLVVFCFVWALSVCLRLMNLTVLLGFSVFFEFLCSNISAESTYEEYISWLIRYSSVCVPYHYFFDRKYCWQVSA